VCRDVLCLDEQLIMAELVVLIHALPWVIIQPDKAVGRRAFHMLVPDTLWRVSTSLSLVYEGHPMSSFKWVHESHA
jgi:hypothetical protein